MLGFVQSIFAARTNPIGVDFGSDGLRLAQVHRAGSDFKLVAAASAQVPRQIRDDPQARRAFFIDNVRAMLDQAPFRGRQAVLALPAPLMHIHRLRLKRLDDACPAETIAAAARDTLPIDPSHAIVRHLVAGRVQLDGNPAIEIIILSAERDAIGHLVTAAEKARLDVIGMNVEPTALVDCFGHVHRRNADRNSTRCFVDIGSSGTRVVIARDAQIFFTRRLTIGGDRITQAVADALRLRFEDARLLRIKLAATEAPPSAAGPPAAIPIDRRYGTEILTDSRPAPPPPAEPPHCQAAEVAGACRATVDHLISELETCRQDHDTAFPHLPVDQLVFLGGEARQRSLCQQIARQMSLASQLGDPLCRMSRKCALGIESGFDPRTPQPAWAIAIGLSMGFFEHQDQQPQTPPTPRQRHSPALP